MDLLQAVVVFVRVVESGSLVRAAERLDLSPPMVTTRLNQLERHLGARLLARTTRRLALTEDGRAFYDRALRILADVAEAEDAVGGRRGDARGRLRVAMPGAFAHLVLMPSLPRLLAQHPALALEILVEQRPLDLVQEGIDCAIRAAPVAEGDLVARRIGTARFVTVASPTYLAGSGAPRHPDELAGHACIGWLAPGSAHAAEWRHERDAEARALAPAGRLAFGTQEACVEAAIEGLGIAHVFSSLAHAPVMSGKLEPLLADWTPPGPPVSVVYPGSRYLSAKVRAFADFAQDVFPTESWWRDILGLAERR